ncbi:nicotinamide N-methyltransferase-like [Bufo bufo]|uniref:nicotinamide N-methyltransferase-like n=1 Tax=Bufo bufo TaxID=8384 RepID=UPI001ABE7A86|nr:nicotinamide N-methyltransferase-like [Bufo bufo]
METVSTSYNQVYEKNFDARKYLDMFYGMDPKTQEIDEESIFLLTFLSNVFSSGRVKGHSLIEIGAGPSIHNILSACEVFEKIYLTDYFQGNLHEIEKWLYSKNDAFDWSPYLRFVCDLQNNRSTLRGKEEKIRRMVSLMKSDVTLSNPLHPNSLPLSDCVLVAGCLICTCKTLTDFKISLKNVVSLIKPGGHLIFIDYLGASYYWVGEAKLPLLSLDEHFVREAVVESGCKIETFQLFKDFHFSRELFDCKNVFSLLAQKL